MNRLLLTLRYPSWRWWADHFIYFYDDTKLDGFGHHTLVCILDTRTDELAEDYRKENEDKIMERPPLRV